MIPSLDGSAARGEWESSFQQIVDRTKQNLNRINQKYAPRDGDFSGLSASQSLRNSENILRQSNTNAASLLHERFLARSAAFSAGQQAKDVFAGNEENIHSILQRLQLLEDAKHQQTHSITDGGCKMMELERTVQTLAGTIEDMQAQSKDTERTVHQLQQKVDRLQSGLDVLQDAFDSRKNTMSKLDSWIRQGEAWREEIDGQLDTLMQKQRQLERTRGEQQAVVSEAATKYELEVLRDKLSVQTQQTVSASLSAWHDKLEQSVRNVERQVALLRIGRTATESKGSDSDEALLLSDEEVAVALQTPLPSELLLKGTVAAEVLQLEQKLEDALEHRLQLSLKSQVHDVGSGLNRSIHRQLQQMCAEMGIEYYPTDTDVSQSFDPSTGRRGEIDLGTEDIGRKARTEYRTRLLEARRQSEEEVASLQRQVQRIEAAIDSVERGVRKDQDFTKGQLSHLQHKVDDCVNLMQGSVSSVKERSARLEDIVREVELSVGQKQSGLKEEMRTQIADISREWSTERAALDRRLLVNERIAEDCLDRIRLSQTAIESYFQNSADVQRFQRNCDVVDEHQHTLQTLQDELRQVCSSVHKLEATSSSRNEQLELRERVSRLEPTVLDKLPDLFSSNQKVMDMSLLLQSKVDALEALTSRTNTEMTSYTEKVGALDIASTQLQGRTMVHAEDIKKVSTTLHELGAFVRQELSQLRSSTAALTGQVSEVSAQQGIVHQATAVAKDSSERNLEQLSATCEALKKQEFNTQGVLHQLRLDVDANRRDVAGRIEQLQARIDHVLVPISGKMINLDRTEVLPTAKTASEAPITAAVQVEQSEGEAHVSADLSRASNETAARESSADVQLESSAAVSGFDDISHIPLKSAFDLSGVSGGSCNDSDDAVDNPDVVKSSADGSADIHIVDQVESKGAIDGIEDDNNDAGSSNRGARIISSGRITQPDSDDDSASSEDNDLEGGGHDSAVNSDEKDASGNSDGDSADGDPDVIESGVGLSKESAIDDSGLNSKDKSHDVHDGPAYVSGGAYSSSGDLHTNVSQSFVGDSLQSAAVNVDSNQQAADDEVPADDSFEEEGSTYSLSDSADSLKNIDRTISGLQQHRDELLMSPSKSPPSTAPVDIVSRTDGAPLIPSSFDSPSANITSSHSSDPGNDDIDVQLLVDDFDRDGHPPQDDDKGDDLQSDEQLQSSEITPAGSVAEPNNPIAGNDKDVTEHFPEAAAAVATATLVSDEDRRSSLAAAGLQDDLNFNNHLINEARLAARQQSQEEQQQRNDDKSLASEVKNEMLEDWDEEESDEGESELPPTETKRIGSVNQSIVEEMTAKGEDLNFPPSSADVAQDATQDSSSSDSAVQSHSSSVVPDPTERSTTDVIGSASGSSGQDTSTYSSSPNSSFAESSPVAVPDSRQQSSSCPSRTDKIPAAESITVPETAKTSVSLEAPPAAHTTPAALPRTLSIKERLKQRQEALKLQKSINSSRSIDSTSPAPTPGRPPSEPALQPSTATESIDEGDAVMSFEELDSSTTD